MLIIGLSLNNNGIITIIFLGKKIIIMISSILSNSSFNFVYFVLSLLANELHSKYNCAEWRRDRFYTHTHKTDDRHFLQTGVYSSFFSPPGTKKNW